MKNYWRLSFAKPGRSCLGVAIVRGGSLEEAIEMAWKKRCNPGGEVLGSELTPRVVAVLRLNEYNRLLSPEEAHAINARAKAKAES